MVEEGVSQTGARGMAAIESGDRNRVTLMLPGECIPFHAVEQDDEVDCLNELNVLLKTQI